MNFIFIRFRFSKAHEAILQNGGVSSLLFPQTPVLISFSVPRSELLEQMWGSTALSRDILLNIIISGGSSIALCFDMAAFKRLQTVKCIISQWNGACRRYWSHWEEIWLNEYCQKQIKLVKIQSHCSELSAPKIFRQFQDIDVVNVDSWPSLVDFWLFRFHFEVCLVP